MTRKEALQILDTIPTIGDQVDALEMAIKALEMGNWIPIKTRPLTGEEKVLFSDREYSEDSLFIFDCPLPDDDQEVLVCSKWGTVTIDTFRRDENDGCYFEEYCDDGDVIAWMPLPEPYKGVENV